MQIAARCLRGSLPIFCFLPWSSAVANSDRRISLFLYSFLLTSANRHSRNFFPARCSFSPFNPDCSDHNVWLMKAKSDVDAVRTRQRPIKYMKRQVNRRQQTSTPVQILLTAWDKLGPRVSVPNKIPVLLVLRYVTILLADRTIGRAFGTVCRLSSVCLSVCLSSVTFCIVAKRCILAKKLSEGVNRKLGSKSWFFGSPPYFYFRFRCYGPLDGRFLPYVLWLNGTS